MVISVSYAFCNKYDSFKYCVICNMFQLYVSKYTTQSLHCVTSDIVPICKEVGAQFNNSQIK